MMRRARALALLGILFLAGCGVTRTAPPAHTAREARGRMAESRPGSSKPYLPNRMTYGRNEMKSFLSRTLGWSLRAMGVAAGSEGALLERTEDGGRHWTPLASTNPSGREGLLPTGGYKVGVSFVSPRVGWLAGSYPMAEKVSPPPLFYETTDGGRDWGKVNLQVREPLPPGRLTLFPPAFFSPRDGVLLGRVGELGSVPGPSTELWVTTDGGRSWNQVPASGSGQRGALHWDVPNRGSIGVTVGGRTWRSADGGRTWIPVS